MKTEFTKRQLRDENIQMANDVLRSCVHCGLCTATCSSYVVLGDERDSPRGRIYLIKDMLESGKPPDDTLVKHMDRCMTCLSCMTTCPSGVDYQHLSDLARQEIEKRGHRPFSTRLARRLLSFVLPHPRRFAAMMRIGRLTRPLMRPLFSALKLKHLSAMLELLPKKSNYVPEFSGGGVARPKGQLLKRVLLLTGCAQQAVRPGINDSSIRLMAHQGIEVIVSDKVGCCGALDLHMGRSDQAAGYIERNVEAFRVLDEEYMLDGIIMNASGCGTTVKDYGHFVASHKRLSKNKLLVDEAQRLSRLVFDISEFLMNYNFGTAELWSDIKVGVHVPCSMNHGQSIKDEPQRLLRNAGFSVFPLDEGHICCGSAGVYNILEPEIARELGARKAGHIAAIKPDVVATGNLGCLTQMAHYSGTPVVHFIELLDWAYGGPCPEGLSHLKGRVEHLG